MNRIISVSDTVFRENVTNFALRHLHFLEGGDKDSQYL